MEHGAGVGHAPVDVVVHTQAIAWPFALVVVAQALAAGPFAAAVVVRHQVVAPVLRVQAGADPRHFGGLGARRALRERATAAGAQKAVKAMKEGL